MNKVFLIGNLTRDPELTETASGVALCHFSIAVGRTYTQGDGERQTDFFNCTAWRGIGETIAKYCKKGNKVAVGGSVQLRNYEDNQGVKRTAVDIIVNDVEFLTPKSNAETDEFVASPSSSTHSSTDTRTSKNKPTLELLDDDSDSPF
jgi:single-strand DNA-binding protein